MTHTETFTLTVAQMCADIDGWNDRDLLEGMGQDEALAILADGTLVRAVGGPAFGSFKLSPRQHEHAHALALSNAAESRGILVANDNAGMGQTCWLLWFGAYGSTKVLAWGSLEDALEDAARVLHEGHFSDLSEEYEYALAELVKGGADPTDESVMQKAQETAETDMTYTERGYLASGEWGYSIENPTLADILELPEK